MTNPGVFTELDGTLIEDPMFYRQHHLSYDGRAIDGMRGFSKLDSRILEAWSISKGDPNIGIGIMDEPVIPHEDMPQVYYFVYDGKSAVESSRSRHNGHGNEVAGVMVAQHNDIGVRGISPNSPLYAAKLSSLDDPSGSYDYYAQAMTWMMENGVGVINQSFGIPPCNQYQTDIHFHENVRFFNKGRNGAGGLIITTSGNWAGPIPNAGCVKSAANHTKSNIVVGSVNMFGNIASYSAYGILLDLVAVSGDVGLSPGITTTDSLVDDVIAGVPSQQYSTTFTGTSASSPIVAGIVSLVIAANPELTAGQVSDIITSTAIDLRAPGKDIETGHGLVDAYAAVLEAQARITQPFVRLDVVDDPIIDLGNPVNFTSMNSRIPVGELTLIWDMGDGTELSGDAISHTYAQTGEYQVLIRAMVNGKEVARDHTYIVVDGDNAPPAAFLRSLHPGTGEYSNRNGPFRGFVVEAPFEWKFTGGFRDRESGTAQSSITWDTGDGVFIDRFTGLHTYTEPGTYQQVLTVTDGGGRSAVETFELTVLETVEPPAGVIDHTIYARDDNGTTVDFSAEQSIAGTLGYLHSWEWDFGDGDSAAVPMPRKTYASPGEYTVTLTVSDFIGKSSSASMQIVIE